MRDDARHDPMPYGVNTIRLRISFPPAPALQDYDDRVWWMRPLRGWTGGQTVSEEPSAGVEQGGHTDQDAGSAIAGAAQQVSAGSSLQATLDRIIFAMSAEASAVEVRGGGQFVKAVSDLPARPAPSVDAANSESGLTAQRPDDTPPVATQAGTSPQPSPATKEHGRLWWWLHDHGLAQTKHEQADLLRKAMGPGSGRLVVDGDGVPVNVEQLSEDEVIELDKKLRAPPYGLPVIGPAAPVMTSWDWHSSKPYKDAIKQLELPGTHSTLNGGIPERKEAERMIKESGGKVLRSEEGHPPGGRSTHHEPHINYETEDGDKATVIVRE